MGRRVTSVPLDGIYAGLAVEITPLSGPDMGEISHTADLFHKSLVRDDTVLVTGATNL